MDRDYLKKYIPNHIADGILPRDPTLKKFLHSGPAALSFLTRLWGFMNAYSADRCTQVIEDYVVHGGDEGATERVLRQACGLKPCPVKKDDVGAENAAAALTRIVAPYDPLASDNATLQKQSDILFVILLDLPQEYFTMPSLRSLKCMSLPSNNSERENLMLRLCDHGLWMKSEAILS